MTITLWFIIIGSLFIFMALSASVLKRLPLTTSMLYLLAGVGIGPVGLGLLSLDPVEQPKLLEHITELAVLISLFTAGLKLRIPLSDHHWRLPVLLAFGSMGITVGLITLVHNGLNTSRVKPPAVCPGRSI
jgi:NhaP-type Na+/H+ or K+/H+ antiporter